jgi:hypothetical protein
MQADDMGLSVAATERIMQVFRRGRIDQVALLPNGAAVEYAAGLVRQSSGLGASTHLNLLEGTPVAPARSIPLLVDGRGFFKHSFLSLWAAFQLQPARRRRLQEQIELEVSAQIEEVRRLIPEAVEELDGHRYVHLLPFVMEILVRRAREWGVRRIRVVNEPFLPPPTARGWLAALFSLNAVKLCLLRYLSARFIPLLQSQGIEYPGCYFGVLCSGRMSARTACSAIERIVARANPDPGTIQIVFHPGRVDVGELETWCGTRHASFYLSARRDAEAAAAAAPELLELVRRFEAIKGRQA